MACELLKIPTDDNVADSDRLAAIRDALDRAGLAAKTAVSAEVGPPKPMKRSWRASMPGPGPNTGAALADTTTRVLNTEPRWWITRAPSGNARDDPSLTPRRSIEVSKLWRLANDG